MSQSLRTQLQDLIHTGIEDQVFPGASVAWITAGNAPEILSLGHHTYEKKIPVTETTQYDVASITKSIPTTAIALLCLQKGILNPYEKLRTYLPAYEGEYKHAITIQDLLEFTVPFSLTLSELKDLPPRKLLYTILHSSVHSYPAEAPVYINTTSVLLTLVIEAVTNQKLDVLAEEWLWKPLGMQHTTFSPQEKENVAPTEIDAWRDRPIQGEVHDESAWQLSHVMTPGSAGLFSTAADLIHFAQNILQTPTENSIFSTDMINAMSRGIGWEKDAEWMGTVPPNTFGKTGFTGCCIVINRAHQSAGVFLSNATWPHRSDEKKQRIKDLRQEFCSLICA